MQVLLTSPKRSHRHFIAMFCKKLALVKLNCIIQVYDAWWTPDMNKSSALFHPIYISIKRVHLAKSPWSKIEWVTTQLRNAALLERKNSWSTLPRTTLLKLEVCFTPIPLSICLTLSISKHWTIASFGVLEVCVCIDIAAICNVIYFTELDWTSKCESIIMAHGHPSSRNFVGRVIKWRDPLENWW